MDSMRREPAEPSPQPRPEPDKIEQLKNEIDELARANQALATGNLQLEEVYSSLLDKVFGCRKVLRA
jgi:hypothetical protein